MVPDSSSLLQATVLDAIAFPAVVVVYAGGEVAFGACNGPARAALSPDTHWPPAWCAAVAAACARLEAGRLQFQLPTAAGLASAEASLGPLPDGNLLMIWQPRTDTEATVRRELAENRVAMQEICSLARAGYFEYFPGDDSMRLSEELLRLRGERPSRVPRPLKGFLASVHPDDYEAVWRAYSDPAWQAVTLDYRIITTAGEVRHLHARCSRERDAAGHVLRMFGIEQDVTDRKRDEQRLAYLAQYDSLTGLPNRNLFIDRLQQAAARALRNQRMMALMFVDLDKFKEINDTFGHAAADRVLVTAAERLRGCLREGDTVARLGGDEFTVLLEDISDVDDVGTVAQKIVATLAEPVAVEHGEFFPSASVGVAIYPLQTDDVDTLLAQGDVAMYHAKDAGRNNFQFFTAELGHRVNQRLSMKNQLRRALERNEFSLHYQPQVDMHSGRVVGIEALLRWRNEAFGAVMPGCFVPLAEEMGLILPIGEWVIATACRQGRDWQAAGFAPVRIAVNLSARQFRQAALAQQVDRALQASGLAPEWLELEITEGFLIEDMAASRRVLTMMRERGIQVALDDFGTGYSSFTYLKNLDFDRLKIDGSFIRHLVTPTPDAANSRAIARAIITLAHNLNLQVIAEGVETAEQFDRLKRNGCDMAQGFLFSEPVPADAMTRLLAAGCLPARTGRDDCPAGGA